MRGADRTPAGWGLRRAHAGGRTCEGRGPTLYGMGVRGVGPTARACKRAHVRGAGPRPLPNRRLRGGAWGACVE